MINAWLVTSKAAQVLGLLSLGSERVVLSWSEVNNSVTLSKVDEMNQPAGVVFDSPVSEIESVAFYRARTYITLGDTRYHLEARDDKVGKGTMDTRSLDVTGTLENITAAYMDAKSNISKFQEFLLSRNVDMRKQGMSSASRFKFSIISTIVAMLILVAGVMISFAVGGASK